MTKGWPQWRGGCKQLVAHVKLVVAITDVLAARMHGDSDVKGTDEVLGVRNNRADIGEARFCRTLPH